MLSPPPPYHLRAMHLNDLDAILEIDRASFPTPAKPSLYEYELTENKLAHYQVLVRHFSISDHIIGYAGYWLMGDEIHISTIAITPNWRGHGLGELLLLNMLFLSYEQKAILATLEVREHNQTAQTLYDKYQFEIVGQRRNYYRDTKEDAILMTRQPLDQLYYTWLIHQKKQVFQRL